MGQIEVYEFLKTERRSGNNDFFCVREVLQMMTERGQKNGGYDVVRRSLMRLSLSGYLDVKMSGKVTDWKRLYRLRNKYIGRPTNKE